MNLIESNRYKDIPLGTQINAILFCSRNYKEEEKQMQMLKLLENLIKTKNVGLHIKLKKIMSKSLNKDIR